HHDYVELQHQATRAVHRSHRAISSYRTEYRNMTTTTMMIMTMASAFASPGWASPVSLERRLAIAIGTIASPWMTSAAAVAYAENPLANNSSVAPRNAGISSGPAM